MEKNYKINIPERDKAPQTNLYVKIVTQDKESLETKPYVFMLPGGPGANHSHYKDYDCLIDIGNIVFHDPRGCGLSDKGDPTTYSMDNYIQDVESIRRHLQLDQIIVLGKSYGAMCAIGYALRYPEAVSKLILAAGSPSFRSMETAKNHVLARGTAEQKAICEKLWKGDFNSDADMAYYLSVMGDFYSYKNRHNEAVNRPVPDYPHAHEPIVQAFSGFIHHFDFEDKLHEIQCETLILVGDEDWITDKKHSQVIANKIPKNELIIFEKADHSLESDVPELYFNAIRNFVTQNH